MGRKRDELAPRLRSFPVGSCLLFYRITRGGIEVARVEQIAGGAAQCASLGGGTPRLQVTPFANPAGQHGRRVGILHGLPEPRGREGRNVKRRRDRDRHHGSVHLHRHPNRHCHRQGEHPRHRTRRTRDVPSDAVHRQLLGAVVSVDAIKRRHWVEPPTSATGRGRSPGAPACAERSAQVAAFR